MMKKKVNTLKSTAAQKKAKSKSVIKTSRPLVKAARPKPLAAKKPLKKLRKVTRPAAARSKPAAPKKTPQPVLAPAKVITVVKPEPILQKPLPQPEVRREPPRPKETAAVTAKPVTLVQPPLPQPAPAEKALRDLELALPVSLKDLAVRLQEKPSALIKLLLDKGMMCGINQLLDDKTAALICEKYGCRIKPLLSAEEEMLRLHRQEDVREALKPRPPIVTFMGHVDHGKTSLLDAIRKSKVVDSEHGGITQHIGAYRVVLKEGEITFLDTPGHEAFTAMRARGASVTDIVVLVVAADDGIMPQTQEAIDHARAANVPIVVAINKIDKPQADLDRVKKQLVELNLTAEDWGGKTITVPVSAKTGQGIDELLEMILLEAQMLELKANPLRLASGVVIEAKLSKGRGPVATLLVRQGTLRLNQMIVVANYCGKVRAMFDDHAQAVSQAPPSFPVELLGLSGVPLAGEEFFVVEDEKAAKEMVSRKQEQQEQQQRKQVQRISLEDLHSQIKEGKLKELKLIIKADVQGSLEAIKDTLNRLNSSEIKLEIIHQGVGSVNASDVVLAVASNALILGFNVSPDEKACELIDKEAVEFKAYNIIYELANEIKAALEGMLEPKLKKVFLGRAEVRKVFRLSKAGMVAGCFILKGKISRNAQAELLRNGSPVFAGRISSLKRFKDDVREVSEGFECGISLAGFEQLMEGDIIEAYEIEKIARKL
jgi:translation initiation factor IF-2